MIEVTILYDIGFLLQKLKENHVRIMNGPATVIGETSLICH